MCFSSADTNHDGLRRSRSQSLAPIPDGLPGAGVAPALRLASLAPATLPLRLALPALAPLPLPARRRWGWRRSCSTGRRWGWHRPRSCSPLLALLLLALTWPELALFSLLLASLTLLLAMVHLRPPWPRCLLANKVRLQRRSRWPRYTFGLFAMMHLQRRRRPWCTLALFAKVHLQRPR